MMRFGGVILSYDPKANVAIIDGSDGPTAVYGFFLYSLVSAFDEYIVVFLFMLILFRPFKKFIRA